MPKMLEIVLPDASQNPVVNHTFSPVDRYPDTGVAKWEDFGSGSVPNIRDSLTVGVRSTSGSAKDRRATLVLRLRNASLCVSDCTTKVQTQPVTLSLAGDFDSTADEGKINTALILLGKALERADVRQAFALGVPFVL